MAHLKLSPQAEPDVKAASGEGSSHRLPPPEPPLPRDRTYAELVAAISKMKVDPLAMDWELFFEDVPDPISELIFSQIAQPGDRPEILMYGVCAETPERSTMSIPRPEQVVPTTAVLSTFVALAAGDPLHATIEPLGYLPPCLRVCPLSNEMMTPLRNALRGRGVRIIETEDLPVADKAADALLSGFIEAISPKPRAALPSLTRTKGITIEAIRAFAEAAAAFDKAKPWEAFTDEVAWSIEPRPKQRHMGACVVMGALGEEFGLSFLPSTWEFSAMQFRAAFGIANGRPRFTIWGVTFDSIKHTEPRDAEEWRRNNLPGLEQDRIPNAIGATAAGKIVRPNPEQLNLMTDLLCVFATCSREEIAKREIRATVGGKSYVLKGSGGSETVDADAPGEPD